MEQVKSLSKKNLILFGMVFFYGSLLSSLYAFSVKFDADIAQLFERAHLFLSTGHLIPYGNVASSGVKVFTPGSFLSAAVGFPMLIWKSPYAAMVLIGILHGAGLLLVMDVLRRNFSPLMLLLYLVFYWCNPWRTSEVFLWNPAYLYFFTSLHFWSAYHMQTTSRPQKPRGRINIRISIWFSILHVLALFGAMQCHGSFVVLVFLSFFLWWGKALKPNWWGIGVGVVLGLLSLLPYFLEKGRNPELQGVALQADSFLFRGIVYVYPFLKGVWYWLRQGSFLFPSHLLNHTRFDYFTNPELAEWIRRFWVGFVQLFGAGTLLIVFRSNLEFFRHLPLRWKVWQIKREHFSNWLDHYLLAAFGALLVASAIIPAEMSFWHLLLLVPISILVPLRWLYSKFQRPIWAKRQKGVLLVVLMYFGLFTMLSALQSAKHQIPSHLQQHFWEDSKSSVLPFREELSRAERRRGEQSRGVRFWFI